MIHRVDARLRDEARRYRLAFACPDCASFDPGAPERGEPPRCAFGFPVEPHLDPDLGADRAEVIFCKAFELW